MKNDPYTFWDRELNLRDLGEDHSAQRDMKE